MMKASRWGVGLVVIGAMVFALAQSNYADDKKEPDKKDKKDEKKKKKEDKKPYEKHDLTALDNSLRDLINVGVNLYNEQGDHAGTYRLYQGSLLTVRPFLSPGLQKRIDDGLATSEKMGTFSEKAFELRRALDDIRKTINPGGGTGKTGETGEVAGKLQYEGKPVAGGYFVTLIRDSKKYSSAIQKDGSFAFKTPIPAGEYGVAIEPITGEKLKGPPLPSRYSSESTSGLTVRVQAGKQSVDLNLVK